MTGVIAVLTSFNRREQTLTCLRRLVVSAAQARIDLGIVLVDDGSSDGTADAVRCDFPGALVETGPGDLFWSRGMHRGLAMAMNFNPEFLLWLNDDTSLRPDALEHLLAESRALRRQLGRPVLVVGATADPAGHLSYGGYVAAGRLLRFRYRKVWSADSPVACEVFNGNCVLIPMEIARVVGNIDPVFEHAMGDTDYALRVRAAGFPVFVASGLMGECPNNSISDTFADTSLPARERWARMMKRKGLPPRSWLHFTRRHGGFAWPLYFLWPYARLLAELAFARKSGSRRVVRDRQSAPGAFPEDRRVDG